jgi:UTP--glucose-1-phosphate uridylyltransferase
VKVRKAVIPVAGLGTRFLPATKVVCKELLPIVDLPTIHYIVGEAHLSGIEEIFFVTASGKSAIEDYFDTSPALEAFLEKKGDTDRLEAIREISRWVEVRSVRQKAPLGLGHAVLMAKSAIGDEPFAVLLGDDIIDAEVPATRQMIDVFEKHDTPVVAVFRVPKDKVGKYGVIDPEKIEDRVHRVRHMVEKPPAAEAPSDLAIIGRYVLTPDVFGHIENTRPGRGGEIQLTDALEALRASRGVLGYEFVGNRYDAGDIFGFLEANIMYAMKRPGLAGKLRELFQSLLAS